MFIMKKVGFWFEVDEVDVSTLIEYCLEAKSISGSLVIEDFAVLMNNDFLKV